jgi:Flp pilus assembly protein TadG
MKTSRGQRGRSGHAVIEVALLSPWIFLLFCGIVDAGFYYYAIISTANAARVASMYTSNTPSDLDNSQLACTAALEEMRQLPNIKNAVNCPANCASGSACTAGPMTVTATKLVAAATPDGAADGTQVRVRYTTVPLFPIPGLGGILTIQRTIQSRQRF